MGLPFPTEGIRLRRRVSGIRLSPTPSAPKDTIHRFDRHGRVAHVGNGRPAVDERGDCLDPGRMDADCRASFVDLHLGSF